MPETTRSVDIAVIGGGIVGLATAHALQTRFPGASLTVLEKEAEVARHQTGNNSGVIHSGIYYKPGSLKARLCVDGARRMFVFCETHGVAHKRSGKVIVASNDAEIERLEDLRKRAAANGVPGVQRVDAKQLKEIEPHVTGVAALWSPNTGIADYTGVCQALKREIGRAGGALMLHKEVTALREHGSHVGISTNQGSLAARFVVTCGGLHADRLARMMGLSSDIQIVPFRGEYYFLRPERAGLVRGLVYPVPDPNLPFLGVHFTVTTDGKVEAGPNAVLAFAREGYTLSEVNPGELSRTLAFPGFQRLARKWWRTGAYEIYRSVNKAEFVRSLQKLVPALHSSDIVRGGAGVRAQAVGLDGALVDDFKFLTSARSLHVINAVSPAATASLSIADVIAGQTPASLSN
jgi:(S)-2-hydroxyglutarate dehydrogenase